MQENEGFKFRKQLREVAYKLWEKESNLKYYSFLNLVEDELGLIYLYAVIFDDLDNQVYNGGFTQWHDNKYSCSLEDLIYFYSNNFCNNKIINELLHILNDVQEILEWYEDGKIEAKNLSEDYRNILIDSLYDKFQDMTTESNSQYYNIRDKVNEETEIYFKNKSAELKL